MATVHTHFDCKHEVVIEVSVEDDVQIPAEARGLGKCPNCMGAGRTIAIAGVAPQPGGRTLVLDSIMMMPLEA